MMRLIYLGFILATLSSCGIKNKFTFFPDNESKISKERLPNYVSLQSIVTSDGKTIQASLFAHNDSLKHPLIVYFHGNGGNLYHRFPYAQKLYDMGQDVLLVSYRGYAESTGKPNEKGIYIDGKSAITYAIDSLGYPEKELTIFGRSLGTTVAIHTSQHRNFPGVILVTPLTSGKDMLQAMGTPYLKFFAGSSYNSIAKINNVKSRILILHGDGDNVVPYKMGKQLFDLYKGSKRFVTIEEGSHNDLQDINPVLFWGEIEKFLKKGG